MRSYMTRAFLFTGVAVLSMISLIVAAGTPAGTVISNQATASYTDSNGNPLSVASNVVTTTVSQVSSVTVSPDRAANANPGDTIWYAHQVTNGGNGGDTIDLTAVSSNGWVTTLFRDNNASGTFDAGDTALTDSDGDLVIDTGAMAADAIINILAAVSVPPGSADGTVDSMVVTGTSSFNGAISDIATDTTTVSAPDVTVVKSVNPVGPQIPGTTLTYTVVVTNSGSGDANAVIVTDNVPANTTFVAGSITLNGAGKTDVGGDDEADHNVTNAGAVTVDAGVLIPTATATITFQVVIN